jgi:hypothetical protein
MGFDINMDGLDWVLLIGDVSVETNLGRMHRKRHRSTKFRKKKAM